MFFKSVFVGWQVQYHTRTIRTATSLGNTEESCVSTKTVVASFAHTHIGSHSFLGVCANTVDVDVLPILLCTIIFFKADFFVHAARTALKHAPHTSLPLPFRPMIGYMPPLLRQLCYACTLYFSSILLLWYILGMCLTPRLKHTASPYTHLLLLAIYTSENLHVLHTAVSSASTHKSPIFTYFHLVINAHIWHQRVS